jgi:hypothetical protein
MKVIASAVLLLTLLSNTSTVNGSVGKAGKSNAAASYSYSYSYTATGKAGKSEAAKSTDGGEEKAGAGACNPETIQGLWQCKHLLLLLFLPSYHLFTHIHIPLALIIL